MNDGNDVHLSSEGSSFPRPVANCAIPQDMTGQFARHSRQAREAIAAAMADLDAAAQAARPEPAYSEHIPLTVSTNHLCRALAELEHAVLATGVARLSDDHAPA